MSVILITGTSKGIGKDLALYYLKNYKVVGCSRSTSNIDNPNYYHYELDICDEKKVIEMVNDIRNKLGNIDVLINNAGIASMNHILLTPLKTVRDIFNTNFIGTFLLIREVGKLMTSNKYGRIVNMTTVATPLRLEGEAIYAASKAAVVSLTEITSRELASFGITVNAVGSTPIQTDLIKNVPEEKINALLQRQAIKRFANINDIINVIDFFASDKSGFITGQTVYLGGV